MIRAFLTALLAACGAVLVISYPQLADPLIRFDDYPAYFGDEELYYEKTLSEGRWLNYWWMARDTLWPSWLAFLVYQAGWATFAAGTATNALGPEARRTDVALLSTLIALSPQAFLISGWFNTLTLGVWIPALFSVAVLALSVRGARWLFLAAAPLSMLSYSTYPLLIFCLLLTRHDVRRSFSGLFFLAGLLSASIILGILLIYTINWYAHGVFGMELAEWREPTPAVDFASLSGNFTTVPDFLVRLPLSSGFGQMWLGVMNAILFVGALALLAVRRPAEAGYVAASVAVSIGLMLVHSLTSGVEIPVRALIVVWVYFAITLLRAIQVGVTVERRPLATVGLLVLVAIFAGQLVRNAGYLADWQDETRKLASKVPEDVEKIVIHGQFSALSSAANAEIIHHLSLSFRLIQLTKLTVVNCGDPLADCYDLPPLDGGTASTETVMVTEAEGVAFVILPMQEQ